MTQRRSSRRLRPTSGARRRFKPTMRTWSDIGSSLQRMPGRALAALGCAALALGCLGTDEPPEGTGIRIGALLPYTGELAASGPSLEQGITFAIEAVNHGGGVAGQ